MTFRSGKTVDLVVGNSFVEVGQPEPLLLGVFHDITERKRAEAQLAGERTLLRTLIDNLPGYIFVKDAAGRYLISNAAHTRLLGAAAEAELIGKTVVDFFPPESARKFDDDDRLLLQSGQSVLEREEPFDADGKPGWHSTTKVLLRDAPGNVAGIVGIRHDITERKRAEAALRESEERFRSFVTASSQVVWTTDPDGKINRDLPEWQAFTGQSAEEARGFGWMNALHPEDRERVSEAWRQAGESRRFYEVEYRLRIHDGTWRHIQARGVPVLEADGGIREWVGTCIDITPRKQAEEALRRSEASLAMAQEQARLGSWELDVATRRGWWSAEMHRLFDRAPALGAPGFEEFLALVCPEDQPKLAAHFAQLSRAAGEQQVEYRSHPALGPARHFISHARAGVDADGRVVKLTGTTQDITGRKQAEQALDESERFVRAALDSLTAHLAVLDMDGTILATNESWRQCATNRGLDWRTVSDGANYLAVCGRATGASLEAMGEITTGIRDVIAGRRTHFVAEFSCPSQTGQQWCVCRVTRFPGSGPVRVVVVHEDITSTRAAQQRFHDLFEFAPDAIVMTNREGLIKLMNRQAEKMFGWTRAELLDQPVEMLMPQDSHEGHASLRQRFMQSAMPRTMGDGRTNLQGKRKDGTVFPVDISLSPMETEEGTMVAAAVRDITERQKAEQMANRSQRLESIGTLAGGIAHDLNNALGPIMMAVELLKMQHPGDVEMLETMESSAQRAAEMVRQLLNFAKGAEGQRVSLQPRHLVREMEKIMKGTFPKNIQLQIRLAGELPAVLGDATQLHQVLLNLCVNARDAMPHGGTLTLEAEPVEVDAAFAGSLRAANAEPGRYLALRVTDTGTGIPPEILDRIFDPFFTTKGPDKGTGLGLSTVMGIVKGHGGFLQVSSQPGRGSTFSVFLPVEKQPSHASEEIKVHSNFRGQGETILYVDDEASMRDVARAVLGRLNFTPMTATDGADALVQIAQNRTALRAIITDLHMPHMDGLTLVRMVRRMLPGVPMIIASGRLEEHLAAEFKALGVHLILDKPFTQDQMAETLQAALQPSAPPA
ncbi:MAG: PAS domain S-box protein [Verrucomicrobia bacterium]|nr:PAS domain S-box protein [Verrucomicrobiota bacterium]